MRWQALPDQARSWYGKEAWLSLEEFTSMLQSVEYRPLINCERWQVKPGVQNLNMWSQPFADFGYIAFQQMSMSFGSQGL